MAIYPGARVRLLDRKYLSGLRMAAYNRVNLHVAVSEATSLFTFFNAPNRASSHFYVRRDGVVEQYVDTAYRAEADLEGNDASVSIETQGGVKSPNGEPWADAQVKSLAQLYAWAVETHGVPVRLAKSSKVGPDSHGLSWHRLGIDGSFPPLPSPLAGRLQRGGGMHYSQSAGKACPGDAKIRQVPAIFEAARLILDPPTPSKPTPPSTPTAPPAQPAPIPTEDDTMPELAQKASGTEQRLKAQTWRTLELEEPTKTTKAGVSILAAGDRPVRFAATLHLTATGVPFGRDVQVRAFKVDATGERTGTFPSVGIPGSSGSTVGEASWSGDLPAGQRLRFEVVAPGTDQDGVVITRTEGRALYWRG